MKATLLFLNFIFLASFVNAENLELSEKQIIRNADAGVYKTVRLMLHFTENAKLITSSDMQNLISAFSSDQKISAVELKVLKQLEGNYAQFAIESPFTKQLLVINKTVASNAATALNFFWDRMNETRTNKDQIANYLYLHLPGRFFEYYYHHQDKSDEMVSILDEYMNYICQNSDKSEWNYLKTELSRIYVQINLGNKEKENEYRMMVQNSYKKVRVTYDVPKVQLAFAE
ncbi:MAG: hypothetical protein IPK03_10175 [Bacteroidetes bacterium]|nr:hypothetical protein [Bacteroidota bacterium]